MGSVLGMGLERKKKQCAVVSLWEYALLAYGRDDVAAACLAAQDGHGLDVCLLLFAAWLAEAGQALDTVAARRADEHCRAWRDDVVRPLRLRRRAWKSLPPHASAYGAIKALEIEAERQQLLMLADLAEEEGLAGSAPAQPPVTQDLLEANLQIIAAAAGATSAAVAGLCRALKSSEGA